MKTDDARQLDFFGVLDGNRGTTQDGNPAADWDAYFAARITACQANRRRVGGATVTDAAQHEAKGGNGAG